MDKWSYSKNLRVRKYLHVIAPIFAGSLIAYLDRTNIAYAALTMNRDLGFSAQAYGMGAGIFFIGYILLEVPGALIAERWSPRKWICRIMISWGIVSLIMALINAKWQFYTVRFMLGAAEASFYPVVYASIVPRWFTPDERPAALAFMLSSLQISAIIGAPLAGWIIGLDLFGLKGWQLLFMTEAAPAILYGVIILFILDDRPEDAAWLTVEEKNRLTSLFETESAEKKSIRNYRVGEALRDKEVLKLCLIYFLWVTGFWGFNYWMPTVLKHASGWSNVEIGWLIVIPMSVALAAMLFTGYSSSRTDEKRWHGAVPMFIGAVGLGVGTFLSDPVINLVFICLTAVGVYSAFGVWWSYPTTFLSGTAAAGAVGLINSFGNMGGYLGPYLTGYVKDVTGSYHGAYLYLGCSLAAAGFLMLTLRGKPVPVNPSAE
jgi:ACS family tartrate transporter-like MFS transporter